MWEEESPRPRKAVETHEGIRIQKGQSLESREAPLHPHMTALFCFSASVVNLFPLAACAEGHRAKMVVTQPCGSDPERQILPSIPVQRIFSSPAWVMNTVIMILIPVFCYPFKEFYIHNLFMTSWWTDGQMLQDAGRMGIHLMYWKTSVCRVWKAESILGELEHQVSQLLSRIPKCELVATSHLWYSRFKKRKRDWLQKKGFTNNFRCTQLLACSN